MILIGRVAGEPAMEEDFHIDRGPGERPMVMATRGALSSVAKADITA